MLLRRDGLPSASGPASLVFVGHGANQYGGSTAFDVDVVDYSGTILWASGEQLGSYTLDAATGSNGQLSSDQGLQQDKSGNFLIQLFAGAHSSFVLVMRVSPSYITDFGSIRSSRFFANAGVRVITGANGYEAIEVSNSDYKPNFAQGTIYTATYSWSPGDSDYAFSRCTAQKADDPRRPHPVRPPYPHARVPLLLWACRSRASIFVKQNLHQSAAVLGAFWTCFGIGALTGGLAFGIIRRAPLFTIALVIIVGWGRRSP